MSTGYAIALKLATGSTVACDWIDLATGTSSCDWISQRLVDQTMSYQLIQTTSFTMHPRLVEYNPEALVWMYKLPAAACWSFLEEVPAGSKTPSFLLQSNVVVMQSLAKHAIHQMLAPAGPRPDSTLLRQPALEGLTRSAWMDSPHRIGRKQFSGEEAAAAAAERREVGAHLL
ncbi:hypothetical protein F511_43519 [Dorcoceras hygrometricum]|uniref:Uncharacterized protein n=1 Tax=Dorcoceras hygrometricum TaxID=472368 RepID=A0A2Z7CVM4_9LAMI|nr:hypothetical protein F511_43519 [Dorcoceras hygrometricum]